MTVFNYIVCHFLKLHLFPVLDPWIETIDAILEGAYDDDYIVLPILLQFKHGLFFIDLNAKQITFFPLFIFKKTD